MQKPNKKFLRSYALDLLVEVNQQPYINKEKLFADAMAFFRWRFTHATAPESLPLYLHEFNTLHGVLVEPRPEGVRVACFITWFVENLFHAMAPLTTKHPEEFENARFSSPSFHLPTGDQVETYLVQWIYWHSDHPHAPGEQPNEVELSHWCVELVGEVEQRHQLDPQAVDDLLANARRFLRWIWLLPCSWVKFAELFAAFLRSESARSLNPSDYALMDVCFVNWFCAHHLDRPEVREHELKVARDHQPPSSEL